MFVRSMLGSVTRLSLQIGSLELAVVNVHVHAAAEPSLKAGAERPHLSPSIQETLRGRFPRRPCGPPP